MRTKPPKDIREKIKNRIKANLKDYIIHGEELKKQLPKTEEKIVDEIAPEAYQLWVEMNPCDDLCTPMIDNINEKIRPENPHAQIRVNAYKHPQVRAEVKKRIQSFLSSHKGQYR